MKKSIKKLLVKYKIKKDIKEYASIFGLLVNIMEKTKEDILGDYYQGCITFGEHGQFFTPNHVTDIMAQLSGIDKDTEGQKIGDMCCGSGRMLLSAAKIAPKNYFIGKDIEY